MTVLPDTWEEYLLTAILVSLLAVTLLTILATLFTRWRLGYIEQRKEALRESLGDLIVHYLGGELSPREVENSLSAKIDYAVLMELVNSLEGSIEGEEDKRLRDLLELKSTTDHFLRWFLQGTAIEKAKACLWFSRVRTVDERYLSMLLELVTASEPYLGYSAAVAVMVHGTLKQKQAALDAVLTNESISDLAVTDLIVTLTRHGEEYHEDEADMILNFIRREDLPPTRRALLVKSLEELGYFHSMEALHEYYRSLDIQNENPVLLEALIRTLTAFGMEEILPDLFGYFSPSSYAELRQAAAVAYGTFRSEEAYAHLVWLLNDPDYQVRYQAARSLARYPDADLAAIRTFTLDPRQWMELRDEIQSQK